jgi:hypothetical protein
MSRLVLGRNMLVTQLSPHGHDLGEPFDRRVPLHNSVDGPPVQHRSTTNRAADEWEGLGTGLRDRAVMGD